MQDGPKGRMHTVVLQFVIDEMSTTEIKTRALDFNLLFISILWLAQNDYLIINIKTVENTWSTVIKVQSARLR